jgi:predicted esterase
VKRQKRFNARSCRVFVGAALACLIGLGAFAQERLDPKKVGDYDYRGTKVVRFEHKTLPCWGAKNPEQTDYFYVAEPKDGHAEGRPLYVALHSAGGSGEEEFEWRQANPDVRNIYAIPEGFYGMFPDCGGNRSTDWWYGGRPALNAEITPEYAEKATSELLPVEKRILAEIAWVIETYKIDPNRVYLCGNSMGGSGTLGIGMRHGDVFAAIKANVPAGIWHAYDRLQLGEETEPEGMPDPPVCLDYSAPNDQWSDYHEYFFDGVEKRKYSYIAYWGNFGHENRDEKVAVVNDLFNTFDWLSVRKDEAYPVFTSATTDDPCPWPEKSPEAPAGQRGAYFRWTNEVDMPDRFEIVLRLATNDELKSKIFTIPTESTADVSLRRLQEFVAAPHETISWSFGERSGKVQADKRGLVTIPSLTITSDACVLILKR